MAPREKGMLSTSTPLRQDNSGMSCFDRLFSPISVGKVQTPRRIDSGFFGSSPTRRHLHPLPVFRKEAVLFLRNLLGDSMKAPHKNSLEIKRIFLEDFPSRLSSRRAPSFESISVKDIYIHLNTCGESYRMQFSLPEAYKLYHKVRSLQTLCSPFSKMTRHTRELTNSLNSSSVVEDSSYFEFPPAPVNQLGYTWKTRRSENTDSHVHSSMFDESQDSGFGSPSDSSSISFYEPIFSPERDILRELKQRNCYAVTSLVLSFLPPEDIQRVSSVSKTWRGIVLDDGIANKKRCEYLIQKMLYKENSLAAKLKETTEDRVLFQDLVNKLPAIPKQPLEKNANKVFQSFVDVGKNLNRKDVLLKCPNCKYPSKRYVGNKYCCTRSLCAYEFCCECFGPFLNNHSCNKPTYTEAVPTIVIGSQKSKRSLRRL